MELHINLMFKYCSNRIYLGILLSFFNEVLERYMGCPEIKTRLITTKIIRKKMYMTFDVNKHLIYNIFALIDSYKKRVFVCYVEKHILLHLTVFEVGYTIKLVASQIVTYKITNLPTTRWNQMRHSTETNIVLKSLFRKRTLKWKQGVLDGTKW